MMQSNTPGFREIQFEWQQRDRRAWAHVPASWHEPLHVVMAFHGAGTDAHSMIPFTGLSDKADQEGFAVVYPQGSGRLPSALSWNAGGTAVHAARLGIDDVGFVRTLIERLQESLPVPPSKWFACGMSNGGAFCYRLSSELPGVFAAVASVAGCLLQPIEGMPPPTSVLHVHGTDDAFVPFAGSTGNRGITRAPMLSVADTVATWVRINQCSDIPEIDELPIVEHDGTYVERTRYVDGRDRTEVELLTVRGGGHTWPGRPNPFNHLGKVTRNLVATDVIWEFFRGHAAEEGAR